MVRCARRCCRVWLYGRLVRIVFRNGGGGPDGVDFFALDTANGNAVLDILRAMADGESRAVVMVTHDLEAAARADRVFVMRDGEIVHMMTRPASREILTAMEAVGERDTDEGAMLR